ncbi:enolase C-terminal domain-like protein [Streptomyces polygonati]|uniref:Enolase C-terminal domain-like protein n=2 Tax=Streptomyces polygonati TaxID=1617087 RepID=A0ABV8HR20_9ACTN
MAGAVPTRIESDVTLPVGTPDELAENASARVADGFTTVKVKVGGRPEADIAGVLAVRQAVPHAALRLDANAGWRVEDALSVLGALGRAGVDLESVEQPVPRHDLEGMAYVRRMQPYRVVADESFSTLEDLVAIVRLGAADVVNIKLAKCGGLTAAVELHKVARAHGLDVLVGCMVESHIGVGAAASLAIGAGSTTVQDLDGAWWLKSSPYRGGMTYSGSEVVLPDRPGTAIDGLL